MDLTTAIANTLEILTLQTKEKQGKSTVKCLKSVVFCLNVMVHKLFVNLECV